MITARTLRCRVAPALALAAALAVPSAALADPFAGAPTAGSLAVAKPVFPIVNDAGGFVSHIWVSPTQRIGADGGLVDAGLHDAGGQIFLDPDSTAGALKDAQFAGTYYWLYSWRRVNPDGTTSDQIFSGVFTFDINGQTTGITFALPFFQDPKRPDAGFTGSFRTNVPAVSVECKITNAGKTVARKIRRGPVGTPLGRERWECLGMSIPESLDGKRLTLTVKVSGQGVVASAAKTFVAR